MISSSLAEVQVERPTSRPLNSTQQQWLSSVETLEIVAPCVHGKVLGMSGAYSLIPGGSETCLWPV